MAVYDSKTYDAPVREIPENLRRPFTSLGSFGALSPSPVDGPAGRATFKGFGDLTTFISSFYQNWRPLIFLAVGVVGLVFAHRKGWLGEGDWKRLPFFPSLWPLVLCEQKATQLILNVGKTFEGI